MGELVVDEFGIFGDQVFGIDLILCGVNLEEVIEDKGYGVLSLRGFGDLEGREVDFILDHFGEVEGEGILGLGGLE